MFIVNTIDWQRGPHAPRVVRSKGKNYHAVAEFQYQTWSQYHHIPWYDRGVIFRGMMEKAGYLVDKGDIWGINELPSVAR